MEFRFIFAIFTHENYNFMNLKWGPFEFEMFNVIYNRH